MKSTFAEQVYALAARIPAGKVTTYGALAHAAGNPRAARAVGMLMRTNKHPEQVPCHRVVSSTGALTGYAFGGTKAKQTRLAAEGVPFRNERADLAQAFWTPR